jgi:hypothetical protein
MLMFYTYQLHTLDTKNQNNIYQLDTMHKQVVGHQKLVFQQYRLLAFGFRCQMQLVLLLLL